MRGPCVLLTKVRALITRFGFDDAGRTVEVLVALTHATSAIAAMVASEDDDATGKYPQHDSAPGAP